MSTVPPTEAILTKAHRGAPNGVAATDTWGRPVDASGRPLVSSTNAVATYDVKTHQWKSPYLTDAERAGRAIDWVGPCEAITPYRADRVSGVPMDRPKYGDRRVWTGGGDPYRHSPVAGPQHGWMHRRADALPVDPRSADYINWLGRRMAGQLTPYMVVNSVGNTVNVAYANAATPMTSAITDLDPNHQVEKWQRNLRNVPIPEYARPGTGDDMTLDIYNPATGQLWDYWKFHRYDAADGTFDHATVNQSGHIADVRTSSGQFFSPDGSTGTGTSAAGVRRAGLGIRLHEIREALRYDELGMDPALALDHPLYITIPGPRNTPLNDKTDRLHVWPAIRHDAPMADSLAAEAYAMAEGSVLRVKADFDWRAEPTAPRRVIKRWLQAWGALALDNGGTLSLTAESPYLQETRITNESDPYKTLLYPAHEWWGNWLQMDLTTLEVCELGYGRPVDWRPIPPTRPVLVTNGGQNPTTANEVIIHSSASPAGALNYLPDPGAEGSEGARYTYVNRSNFDVTVRSAGNLQIDGITTGIVIKPGQSRTFRRATRTSWVTEASHDGTVQAALDAKLDAPTTGRAAGKILAAGAGASDTSWIDAPTGTGGGGGVQVQTWTTPGTYTTTKPAGAVTCRVQLLGGGGGGGSGARGAAGTARCGGGSGGPGGYSEYIFPATSLPTNLTVIVSGQANGGAAATSDSTAGAAGSWGGESILRNADTSANILYAGGGTSGGAGGIAAGGSAGAAGPGTFKGNNGVGSSATGGPGSDSPVGSGPTGTGGGSGGGVTTANVASTGGRSYEPPGRVYGLTGTATAVGADGLSGTAYADGFPFAGRGGFGGGGSDTGAAGAGGDGGPGAGGGGGGGGTNGATGGAGGKGGAGFVQLTWSF